MSLYDAAWCLSELQTLLKRPTVDEDTTPTQLYSHLTNAQTYWLGQIATHCPEMNYGAPELLTTIDGGLTYRLNCYPLGGVEVRESRNGLLLRPGPDWDDSADFTPEGQVIRIPGGRKRAFSNGPYARYVATPSLLDADHPPVLRPGYARLLLVPRAAYYWSVSGGYRDPSPYLQLEQKLWSGDPMLPGDVGMLGQLKAQYFGSGLAAVNQPYDGRWWVNSDFGA